MLLLLEVVLAALAVVRAPMMDKNGRTIYGHQLHCSDHEILGAMADKRDHLYSIWSSLSWRYALLSCSVIYFRFY